MMGWLARQDGYDPNAFDVPLEQSTGVGWANRLGEILTTRPPDNPAVAYKTPYFDITEGDIGRATEAALGGMTVTPKGIKAYHSSPHDFDKFDLAKIGTGEGAQVYGHGLYFAESPAVSGQGGQYWQQFLPRMSADEQQAARRLAAENFDRKAAIETTQQILDRAKYPERFADQQRMLELLKGDKPVGPRTYEVNINADPVHMLDWDKAMREQSPLLNELAGKRVSPEDTGAKAYREIARRVSGTIDAEAMPAASTRLREAGIPGIKYLDQGSRVTNPDALRIIEAQGSREAARAVAEARLKSASTGDLRYWDNIIKQLQPETSNYVVFDPGIIDIMKKYGLAGATAVPVMGSLASEGNYQTEERY